MRCCFLRATATRSDRCSRRPMDNACKSGYGSARRDEHRILAAPQVGRSSSGLTPWALTRDTRPPLRCRRSGGTVGASAARAATTSCGPRPRPSAPRPLCPLAWLPPRRNGRSADPPRGGTAPERYANRTAGLHRPEAGEEARQVCRARVGGPRAPPPLPPLTVGRRRRLLRAGAG